MNLIAKFQRYHRCCCSFTFSRLCFEDICW